MFGIGEKFKFLHDRLDQVYKVEPIVIEGFNHAINFGLEFLKQNKVNSASVKQEVKLITRKGSKEKFRIRSAKGVLISLE